jgi:CRISPR-associated protein Cmr4
MKTTAYIITCKTNMHAGKGSTDQGVIDNLVQKDHTEGLPCIYSSSLKGAFREYFEEYICKQDESLTQDEVNNIFGWAKRSEPEKENDRNKKDKKDKKGNYLFHDALLLSIPARSNRYNFFHTTCPMALKRLVETLKIYGLRNEASDVFLSHIRNVSDERPLLYGVQQVGGLQIEHFSNFDFCENTVLNELFNGESLLIVSDDQFKLMNEDYNLPVVARNQLENGESKNLFYEQIIPRESKFFFIINSVDNSTSFEDNLLKHVKTMPVQIGANASIGYGFSIITSLNVRQTGGNGHE